MNCRITVLGAGMMGSALVKCWAGHNRSVTVWNRSLSRLSPLLSLGVHTEADLGLALSFADLIFLIVSNYGTAHELLEQAGGALRGKLVVNGITGTAEEARRMADFVTAEGGRYLDVGIMCYPADIGTEGALMTFGGDPAGWEVHEALFREIAGGARFLGADPGLPNITDAVVAGAFFNVALGAFHEAAAFGATAGLKAADLAPIAIHMLGLLGKLLREEAAPAIDSGQYGTDQATLDVYVEAVRQWRKDMLLAGQRASLMTANLHNLELAQAAGHGGVSIYSQYLTCGVGNPKR